MPPNSFSESSYTAPFGTGMIPASAAFATQAYHSEMTPVDPSPTNLQYLSPPRTVPSLGHSDIYSTDPSISHDWMETDASEAQVANFLVNHTSTPSQPTTQHYHAFLQDFYRSEGLLMGNFGQ
jgi:hypothetical protein